MHRNSITITLRLFDQENIGYYNIPLYQTFIDNRLNKTKTKQFLDLKMSVRFTKNEYYKAIWIIFACFSLFYK